MKKYLSLIVGCALLFSVAVIARPVSASVEDDMFRFLRSVGNQVDLIRDYITQSGVQETARFDSIDSKLERIYESCGRGTTPTRRVTTAQVSTCVNACFTSSLTGPSEQGALNQERFTSCVARCPSNTLRNLECGQAYVLRTSTAVQQGSEYIYAAQNADAYTRSCIQRVGSSAAAMCRVIADVLVSNLKACLFDQTAYTCQSDCMRNYRNDSGAVLCLLRCENRTRAASNFEQIQQSGILKEDGSLAMDTMSNTLLDSIAATRVTVAPPSTSPAAGIQTLTPTRETYSQCVYRCGDERTTCIAAPPAGQDCEQNYSGCYQSCNARLLNGSSR